MPALKSLIIDVSNPIARRDGDEIVKLVDAEGGPGLATAKRLPGARLVRGFNAIRRLEPWAVRGGEIARHIYESESEMDGKPNNVRIGTLQVWQKQGGNWKLLARQGYKLA